MTCAGLALAATTPLDRLLTALLKLRVPFPLAFLSVMALRFLPEVAREVLVVRQARARRGRSTWRRSPASWIRLELALLRPIVARSLRRSRTLAESLELRGFDATSPRAVHRPLHMGKGEFMLLALTTLACSAVAGAAAIHDQELAYFLSYVHSRVHPRLALDCVDASGPSPRPPLLVTCRPSHRRMWQARR